MAAAAELGGIVAAAAYLDLAEPDLATVCTRLAAEGHQRAVVVPLLFTQAFHARVDVPEAVADASTRTGLALPTAEILGTGSDVADLLTDVLVDAGVSIDADVLLYAVGSSDPAANAAVADLARALQTGRQGRARAAFATVEPRLDAVLPELSAPLALVPLFLADGLLLAPLRRLAADRGWTMTEPLGERAAALVLRRYQTQLTTSTDPAPARPTDTVGRWR